MYVPVYAGRRLNAAVIFFTNAVGFNLASLLLLDFSVGIGDFSVGIVHEELGIFLLDFAGDDDFALDDDDRMARQFLDGRRLRSLSLFRTGNQFWMADNYGGNQYCSHRR